MVRALYQLRRFYTFYVLSIKVDFFVDYWLRMTTVRHHHELGLESIPKEWPTLESHP